MFIALNQLQTTQLFLCVHKQQIMRKWLSIKDVANLLVIFDPLRPPPFVITFTKAYVAYVIKWLLANHLPLPLNCQRGLRMTPKSFLAIDVSLSDFCFNHISLSCCKMNGSPGILSYGQRMQSCGRVTSTVTRLEHLQYVEVRTSLTPLTPLLLNSSTP